MHVLGGGIGVGAPHEAGDVAIHDAFAFGGVVQAMPEVVEAGEGELADAVERQRAVRALLDDVHDVLAHRRVVAESDRHMVVEQQVGVAIVRDVRPPAAEKEELDHGAICRAAVEPVKG